MAMASNNFTISPTGGTGNASLYITPSQQNNTTNDRVATVSITNGTVTKTVTATQFGKPSITGLSLPISAPATGGSYSFTIHTHYDVQFPDKPDWVKIDDGQGNYITTATTIDKNVANGRTYNLRVDPNNTYNDRNESFGMYHYINQVQMSDYVSISISQPQGAADFITLDDLAIDWDSTNGKSVQMSTSPGLTWSASIDNTTDFELGGGQGYVTVRAKANNTGSTLKTTTLSIASTKASFPYTATCVVTQFRQPTISIVDDGTVPPTGGSKSVRVASDYYWWIYPTVMPETPTASIPYITMTGKVAGQNMSPTTGATYTLTWNSNDGNIRNDNLYVAYLKTDNSTTGISTTYANYTQRNEASETISVSPNRIPAQTGEYVASGGGTYQVVVTTSRSWQLQGTPSHCTVSPSTGTATTTVTITVPPSAKSGSSYHWVENITFVTSDAGTPASDTVSVWQYDSYQEPAYLVVTPASRTISSGGSPSLGNYFEVSANTDWVVTYQADWLTFRTQPIGGSLVTGGTSGVTNIYISCSQNTGTERSDVVWFTPAGAGVATTSVTVTQSEGEAAYIYADNYIDITTPNRVMGNTFSVTANTAWTASTEDPWILISRTSQTGQSGETTGTFAVEANDSLRRCGSILFEGGGASARTSICQAAAATPTWIASPNTFDEPSGTSQTLTASITANTSWYVSKSGDGNGDWIVILQPTSTQTALTYDIKFYITQNNTGSPRSGRIDIISALDDTWKLSILIDQE